jgi:hypothetical protein
MNPFELGPSIAPTCRPVIVSAPLAGTVALSLPLLHGGVLYLVQVAWRRGDPLETTDVVLDPEPPAHRDVLAVLDAVEDTAKARAGATPDPHSAVLWQQAAQRIWTYAADYGDAWAEERVPSAALVTV